MLMLLLLFFLHLLYLHLLPTSYHGKFAILILINKSIIYLQGSHILTTLRPLEKLRSLLSTGNVETDAVASFFQQYGVRFFYLHFIFM